MSTGLDVIDDLMHRCSEIAREASCAVVRVIAVELALVNARDVDVGTLDGADNGVHGYDIRSRERRSGVGEFKSN